jgi:hypothetical protein
LNLVVAFRKLLIAITQVPDHGGCKKDACFLGREFNVLFLATNTTRVL